MTLPAFSTVALLACATSLSAAVTPSFRITESWIDRIVATRDVCDTPPCPIFYDVVATNTATFSMVIPWDGIDLASLQELTPFTLHIGEYTLDHILQNDPAFTGGTTSPGVTLVIADTDEFGRRSVLSRVSVTWTPTALLVSGYDRMLPLFIVAGDHLEQRGVFREWVPAQVTLGGFTFERNLFCTGNTTIRAVTYTTGGETQQALLSTVSVSGAADYTRPAVAFRWPASGARWSNEVITVRGIATDNTGVAGVKVKVNDGEFVDAQGTNSWTAAVTLQPGLNTIYAKAVDSDTNESLVVLTRVVFVVVSPLTLNINPPNSGRVIGVANGQLLEVNKPYAATATAFSSNLFAGWTGDWPGTNPVLRFTMLSNMTLTANFVPNPFLPRRGTYVGLYQPTNQPAEFSITNAGSFSLALASYGTFSGRIVRRGLAWGFTGRFNLEGKATVVARRLGSESLNLNLQLDVAGNTGVSGEITDGILTSALRAELVGPSAATGMYTLLWPGTEDASTTPGGPSYGRLSVASTGGSSLSGMLGDGLPVYLPGYATRNGKYPLFAVLYGGRGMIHGWLDLTRGDMVLSAQNEELHWIKPPVAASRYPAGFHLAGPVQGARHVAPPTGTPVFNWTSGVVRCSGGNLPAPITNQVVLATNKLTVVDPGTTGLTIVLQPPYGLFYGSLRHPTLNRLVSFRGVLLRPAGMAGGLFLGTSESGAVVIEPAAP